MDGNPIKDRLGSVYTDSLRKIFPSLQVIIKMEQYFMAQQGIIQSQVGHYTDYRMNIKVSTE